MKSPNPTYRFGSVEFRPSNLELRVDGELRSLEPKSYRTLAFLVENSGRVVSKEEILQTVWAETAVTDNALTRIVAQIRKALEDDPREPKYIETVATVGYRFIAHVNVVDDAPVVDKVVGTDMGATSIARPDGFWILRKRVAAALLVLGVASGGAWLVAAHRKKPVLTERDTIMLADFTNSTGDAVFDGTLRQGMEVQLKQSPFLSLVPEERIQKVKGLMGQPANAQLTPAIAREICERTGSIAVVDGSIAPLGSQYVLGVRAIDCVQGKILAEDQVQAAKKEDVLKALDQAAGTLRTRLGESLTTLEKYDTPLTDATTSSLEALKSYSTGWKVQLSTGAVAAVPYFKRAIEIDPKFAVAYATLGLLYGSKGESDLAAENTSKAYELRDRTSENEKFFITAYYDGRVTGNQEKAQQTCETWARIYPREVMPHFFMTGFIYPVLDKKEKAIEEGKKAIQLGPDATVGYTLLATAYLHANRLEESETTLQRASERKLQDPDFILGRYDIAFLKGDSAGMEREAALAQNNSGAEDWVSDHEAFAMAYTGHLKEARRMSRHAAELAQQAAHGERAALFDTGPALWEALFGDGSAARKSAMAARERSKDREVEYGAAFALALSGDSSQAQTLANDLERRFPEDTSVKFSYLPAIRALIVLNHGEPAKAIELLQIAIPHELGTPRSKLQGSFGALYPVYVRGQAYLAAHQGAKAAGEFQKILDHRGAVASDPIGALAQLQLGRAYALSGDKTKAKSAYQNFLTLWKDADPDIPILKQAKAEYLKLN